MITTSGLPGSFSVLNMMIGESSESGIGSSRVPSTELTCPLAAGAGDDGGCERIVISTSSGGGDVVALVGDAELADMVCRLLLPLSRRGRLRVKLGSASSTESRRGGEGEDEGEGKGGGEVDAGSSAAGSCSSAWSWALMTECERAASGAEVVFAQARGWSAIVGRYRQQWELQVQPYERAGAACGLVKTARKRGTMSCGNDEKVAQ